MMDWLGRLYNNIKWDGVYDTEDAVLVITVVSLFVLILLGVWFLLDQSHRRSQSLAAQDKTRRYLDAYCNSGAE